jgi:hypothetical protein
MKTLKLLLVCLAFTACATPVEWVAHVLDGQVFAEKTITEYRPSLKAKKSDNNVKLKQARDGSERLVITLKELPSLTFYATSPDSAGQVFITGYNFLSPNYDGWNDLTMDLSGTGSFRTLGYEIVGRDALFKLTSPLEIVQISGGKIRRGDARITGSQAISALKNRRERLAALAEWMHSREGAPVFTTQKAFEKYWKPILMPELAAARKRPAEWQTEGATWNWAEEVKWNTSYTAAIFPEDLCMLRDSGSLLRDWEEAVSWLYLEYQWDSIVESLSRGLTLVQTKALKRK